MSLAQLTAWCDAALRRARSRGRPAARRLRYSLGGDGQRGAARDFGWRPETPSSRCWKRSRATPRTIPDWLERAACHDQPAPIPQDPPLELLTVVIPARDEEGCIAATVEHLHVELRLHNVPTKSWWWMTAAPTPPGTVLPELATRIPTLRPVQNTGEHGFGRAIACGIEHSRGDAVVVMMADESDDCRDVVRYWEMLNEGWDAVFGSRFVRGGGVIDYPWAQAAGSTAWPISFCGCCSASR